MRESIEIWLAEFRLDATLHAHAVAVVLALPAEVRGDLVGDGAFRMSDHEPRGGHLVPVGSPRLGKPARTVALKRSLREKPEEFIRYVIAHELAHAFLRNEGRTAGEDPEFAADALAGEWGFPRPAVWPFPVRR